MKIQIVFLSLLMGISAIGQEVEPVSTASDNVHLLGKAFVIPDLNEIAHKVWVYLPPNYDNNQKFPVIYMHDGQNLFDSKTSYIGEWGVDELLNDYYKQTGKGFIVVGVENGQMERINEYTPWPNKKYGGGKGTLYVDFLVNTLKPYIDQDYRTKKGRKHTAIAGSSLGGLISYYAGLKYPEVFGKVGALSTSFWFSDEVITFTQKYGKIKNQKLFLLIGGQEGKEMVDGHHKTIKLLKTAGFRSKNINAKIVPDGKHNEAFWKSEFLNIIAWLYNKEYP